MSYNIITNTNQLGNLPKNCKQLYFHKKCSNLGKSSFEFLPESLETLVCNNYKQEVEFSNLPISLKKLSVVIKDIEEIKNLSKNLTHLELYFDDKIISKKIDLSHLQLKYLGLENCNNLTFIYPITLQELNLKNSYKVNNLPNKLKTFKKNYYSSIYNLFKNCEIKKLYDIEIPDIFPKNLQEFILCNELSEEDYSVINAYQVSKIGNSLAISFHGDDIYRFIRVSNERNNEESNKDIDEIVIQEDSDEDTDEIFIPEDSDEIIIPKDSDEDSNEDSNEDSDEDSNEDSDEDSDEDSNEDSDEDSDEDCEEIIIPEDSKEIIIPEDSEEIIIKENTKDKNEDKNEDEEDEEDEEDKEDKLKNFLLPSSVNKVNFYVINNSNQNYLESPFTCECNSFIIS
jgi:hypothetical protein